MSHYVISAKTSNYPVVVPWIYRDGTGWTRRKDQAKRFDSADDAAKGRDLVCQVKFVGTVPEHEPAENQ